MALHQPGSGYWTERGAESGEAGARVRAQWEGLRHGQEQKNRNSGAFLHLSISSTLQHHGLHCQPRRSSLCIGHLHDSRSSIRVLGSYHLLARVLRCVASAGLNMNGASNALHLKSWPLSHLSHRATGPLSHRATEPHPVSEPPSSASHTVADRY